jgi:hypothetical protein
VPLPAPNSTEGRIVALLASNASAFRSLDSLRAALADTEAEVAQALANDASLLATTGGLAGSIGTLQTAAFANDTALAGSISSLQTVAFAYDTALADAINTLRAAAFANDTTLAGALSQLRADVFLNDTSILALISTLRSDVFANDTSIIGLVSSLRDESFANDTALRRWADALAGALAGNATALAALSAEVALLASELDGNATAIVQAAALSSVLSASGSALTVTAATTVLPNQVNATGPFDSLLGLNAITQCPPQVDGWNFCNPIPTFAPDFSGFSATNTYNPTWNYSRGINLLTASFDQWEDASTTGPQRFVACNLCTSPYAGVQIGNPGAVPGTENHALGIWQFSTLEFPASDYDTCRVVGPAYQCALRWKTSGTYQSQRLQLSGGSGVTLLDIKFGGTALGSSITFSMISIFQGVVDIRNNATVTGALGVRGMLNTSSALALHGGLDPAQGDSVLLQYVSSGTNAGTFSLYPSWGSRATSPLRVSFWPTGSQLNVTSPEVFFQGGNVSISSQLVVGPGAAFSPTAALTVHGDAYLGGKLYTADGTDLVAAGANRSQWIDTLQGEVAALQSQIPSASSPLTTTQLTVTAASDQVVFKPGNAAPTITVTATNPAASRTYTLPDAGVDTNVTLDAAYSNFSNKVIDTALGNSILFGGTQVLTVTGSLNNSQLMTLYTAPVLAVAPVPNALLLVEHVVVSATAGSPNLNNQGALFVKYGSSKWVSGNTNCAAHQLGFLGSLGTWSTAVFSAAGRMGCDPTSSSYSANSKTTLANALGFGLYFASTGSADATQGTGNSMTYWIRYSVVYGLS